MGRIVGIVVHRTRPEALAFAQDVIAWLEARNIDVVLDREAANRLGRPALGCDPSGLQAAEFIITLGGDGTILTAARLAAECAIPILGVHMGRFGFISEAHPSNLFEHLEAILRGEMQVEERMMIRADVWRNGEVTHSGVGLNDALVKSKLSHMLQIRMYLDSFLFATYPADGVLVATPTGSTAYALSAGGPLVVPTVQALLVVPVCPHTLSARPMIVPAEEEIGIEIDTDGGEVLLAVDGVEPVVLQSEDRIVIKRAEFFTRLIVLGNDSFYRKVRERYLYGERLNDLPRTVPENR